MTRGALVIFLVAGCGSPDGGDSRISRDGCAEKMIFSAPAMPPDAGGAADLAKQRGSRSFPNACVKWVENLGYGCYWFRCKGDCPETPLIFPFCGMVECDPYDPRPYNPGYPGLCRPPAQSTGD